MELDELKTAWVALDNRLKENDTLKETIILEIIQNKTNKSVNKLLYWDIFNLISSIVFIPVVWSIRDWAKNVPSALNTICIYAIILLFIFAIWYAYKVYGLMKFDFAKNVRDNIYYINRYNIQMKWEKLIGIIISSVAVILGVLGFVEVKANTLAWIILVCTVLLCTLFIYWIYWRIYDKNISSVLKSLEELKALKD
jgi:hypothetical protein